MRKTETVQIGQHSYKLTQLPVLPAMTLVNRVRKIVQGPLAAIAENIKEGGGAEGLTGADIAKMLRAVDLEDSDLEYLVELFRPVSIVTMGDKTLSLASGEVFEAAFAGDTASVFTWIWHSVALNVGDAFLGRLGVDLSRLKAAAENSISQATSIGRSGESPPQNGSPSD